MLITRIMGRQVMSDDKGSTWNYRSLDGELLTAHSLTAVAIFMHRGV
jgi:hypothetical protein